MKSLIAALLLGGALCSAQAVEILPRAGKPEEVGLSSERLARLTKITQDHVDAGRLPGAVILIVRRGRIAYYEAFGYRDRDKGLPMARDSLFRIYSMTKPITTTAAMGTTHRFVHDPGQRLRSHCSAQPVPHDGEPDDRRLKREQPE